MPERQIIRILASLGTLALSLFLFGATGVPFVFAQSSGDFVFMQQGLVGVSVATTTDSSYISQLGSGFQGTTTGAFVTASASFNTTALSDYPFYLVIYQSNTSAYAREGGYCVYESPMPFSEVYSEGFQQLAQGGCGGGATWDFVLNPTKFYEVEVDFEINPSQVNSFVYYGTSPPTHVLSSIYGLDSFEPQFAVVGDGFQITPSASSSGLFLSGALNYCAQAFASSSAPGILLDTAVAFCDVGGYLFVPTPLSLQQFGNFVPELQTKIPFSYAYSLVSLYGSLTASSTSNLPTFSISWPNFASSSPFANIIPSSVPIMSTTTISAYYPDPIRNTFLFLGTCAIWVEALLVCYRRIVPQKVL